MCACKRIESSLGKLNKNNLQTPQFIETSRKNTLLMEEEMNARDGIGCFFS